MYSKSLFLKRMCLVLFFMLGPRLLHAAEPVIHLQWDQGGTPVENTHYRIKTTSPASPSYPNVELLFGHDDWRIWSTDTDNENGYGDIGAISCPASQNFGVRVLNQAGEVGARNIRGFHLVPTSSSNYSKRCLAGASPSQATLKRL